MLDDAMRNRFESVLRTDDLRSLVDEFRAEGIRQVAIYDLFSSFALTLRSEARESDEDRVVDAMDFIWGWCPKGTEWFDHTLSDEELREYRASVNADGTK